MKKNVNFRWGVVLVAGMVAFSAVALQPAVAQQAQAKKKATQEEEAPPPPPPSAFKMGEFLIKDYHPVEHERVKLRMTVYVDVDHKYAEQFEELLPIYRHRARGQVITAARLIPALEYDDPTLHALRRRIFLRLRRALPMLKVEQVYISDFSYLVD